MIPGSNPNQIIPLPMGDLWRPPLWEKNADGEDIIVPRKDNIDASRLPAGGAQRGPDVAAILKEEMEREMAKLFYESQLAAEAKPAK